MSGSVITFYSYKGGVGRSFALANAGYILAEWGYRVLVVDWDIEAPGLNHYFAQARMDDSPGVLEFIDDCRKGEARDWSTYVVNIEMPRLARLAPTPTALRSTSAMPPPRETSASLQFSEQDGSINPEPRPRPAGRGRLCLMPACSAARREYIRDLQSIDWDELYNNNGFGQALENLRAQWVENLDFVLIDSRTGVTDFSGVTTVQLPDVLVFLFSANRQSLEGCCDIARRAADARRALPVDRPALLQVPVPARFDAREEYDRASAWRQHFIRELPAFFDSWAPQGLDYARLIDLLTIPYVPRWTFGEDLCAAIEGPTRLGTRSLSTPVSYVFETLAALLANGCSGADNLCSNRDEYVRRAKSAASSGASVGKVFISYRRDDSRYQARAIYEKFTQFVPRENVFMDLDSIPPGADFRKMLKHWVDQCDVLLVLIGPSWVRSADSGTGQSKLSNPSDFVRIEIAGALARDIPVVPVLLDGASMPRREQLPEDLKELVNRNAARVEFSQFDEDVQRLIRNLQPLARKGEV